MTLVEYYPNDIKESFINECLHFCDIFFSNRMKRKLKNCVKCYTKITEYMYVKMSQQRYT